MGDEQADQRADHLKRRRKQGVTFRQLGDEFHTSKSTAHRMYHAKKGGVMAKSKTKDKDTKKPAKKSQMKGDTREGRLHLVKTDRGSFRFKDNRKGDSC